MTNDILVRREVDGRFLARRASGRILDWRVSDDHVDLTVRGGIERWNLDLTHVSHLRTSRPVFLGPGFVLVNRGNHTHVLHDDGAHARWNGATTRLFVHGDRAWRSSPEGVHRIDGSLSTYVAPESDGFVAAGADGAFFRVGRELYVVWDHDVLVVEASSVSGFFLDGRAYAIGQRDVVALDGR